jgi:hypothetical protein
MVLAMAPLFLIGLSGLVLDRHHALGRAILEGAPYRLAVIGMMVIVLTHYCADAFLYRMRIPAIRQVMLRRLGFAQAASSR